MARTKGNYLHTGVPYLDGMIDSDSDIKLKSRILSTERDSIKIEHTDRFGSIRIPDSDTSRTNIIIKGDPGSGKTALACQIALNLANDIYFINHQNEKNDITFDEHQQIVKKREKPDRVYIPIIFSFGQSLGDLKRMYENLFFTNGKYSFMKKPGQAKYNTIEHPRQPILVCLRDADARSGPHIDEINDCVGDLQELIASLWPETQSEPNINDLFHKLRLAHPKMDFDFPYKEKDKTSVFYQIKKDKDRKTDIVYVVFIDSINAFFSDFHDRMVMHKLLGLSREFRTVTFMLLEDYATTQSQEFLYLAKSLEFDADIVMELTSDNEPYYKRYIEITKNRYAPRVNGKQLYKIASAGNAIGPYERRIGLLIYFSIHNHFVHSRHPQKPKDNDVSTGIRHLDKILTGEKQDSEETKNAVPSNSFILVRGPSGGHKLSLAFNILVGGVKENDASSSAMIISFHDENTMNLEDIAIAMNLNPPKEEIIKIENDEGTKEKDGDGKDSTPKKISINKYMIRLRSGKMGTLHEVTFRPGFLTTEEFFYAFEQLIVEHAPARVLIDNTNLMRMRFTELCKDTMLLAAVLRFLKAHNILSILIDVTGEGSLIDLSYGLKGMADYILQVDPFSQFIENDYIYRKNFDLNFISGIAIVDKDQQVLKMLDKSTIFPKSREEIKHIYYPISIENAISGSLDDTLITQALRECSGGFSETAQKKPENDALIDFSILSVSNVRNKVYSKSVHGITAVKTRELRASASLVKTEAGLRLIAAIDAVETENAFFIFDLPRLMSICFE